MFGHPKTIKRIVGYCVLLMAVCVVLGGCGGRSDMGTVTGTVKLDGQPLADARIIFQPTGDGSPSYGKTDANGQYELQYSRDVMGAKIGSHVVIISTYQGADLEADPPVAGVEEKVPDKYNNPNSELKEDVKAGPQTIDFDLEAGEVTQPEDRPVEEE